MFGILKIVVNTNLIMFFNILRLFTPGNTLSIRIKQITRAFRSYALTVTLKMKFDSVNVLFHVSGFLNSVGSKMITVKLL